MILTQDDLDREWQWLFLRCKNTAAAKAEILTLFSDEPDDEHEWSEQDLHEQMRKIIKKYSYDFYERIKNRPQQLTLFDDAGKFDYYTKILKESKI